MIQYQQMKYMPRLLVPEILSFVLCFGVFKFTSTFEDKLLLLVAIKPMTFYSATIMVCHAKGTAHSMPTSHMIHTYIGLTCSYAIS